MKVKLAAIARDEAAYLPEWIFHHLHFGFDEIEIYVNNTIDNSTDVLNKISVEHPVKFVDADPLFEKSNGDFQFRAYREIAKNAKEQGFSHLMFLDIDEFWTPVDFNTSIKQVISKLGDLADVICFEWLLHCNEYEFARCFENELKVKRSNHVKSLLNLSTEFDKVGAHNVIGKNVTYVLANGQGYDFGDDIHCAYLSSEHQKSPIKNYFVIHRMYRSEMEYVSLLGRGRPSSKKVKNNRAGYYRNSDPTEVVGIMEEATAQYYNAYAQFLDALNLQGEIELAQQFVLSRFHKVLKNALTADNEEKELYLKLFRGVELPKVAEVINTLRGGLSQTYLLDRYKKENSFSSLFKKLVCNLLIMLGKEDKAVTIISENDLISSRQSSNEDLFSSLDFSINRTKKVNKSIFYRDVAISLYKSKNMILAKEFIVMAKSYDDQDEYINKLFNQITWEASLPKDEVKQ